MSQILRSDERAWRELTEAARKPDTPSDLLLRLVKATAGRTIPATSPRDQAAFAALQALARACAMGRQDRRKRLNGCLVSLAIECGEAASWSVEGPKENLTTDRDRRSTWDLFEHHAGRSA